MKEISIEELDERRENDWILADLRSFEEFKKESLPGAINIPISEMPQKYRTLPHSKKICVFCHTGKGSKNVCEFLEKEGYEVCTLKGGFVAFLAQRNMQNANNEEFAAKKTYDAERSIIKKFRKDIWCKFTKAINTYELIKENDKIAVCISGGKDSMLMAKLFQEILKHGKFHFELVFLLMNPGYNKENYNMIISNAKLLGIPLTIFESEIFDTVAGIEKNPCYLCARMRRGYLYSKAKELGCNKIALGHHFDDVIETVLMGMLYSGKFETMMPKLHSTNFEGMELIRPMYMIKESAVKAWRDYNNLHFIQCACRFTENYAIGDEHTDSKRAEMKELINDFRKKSPLIETNIFNSIHNVNLETIIGYHKGKEKYNFLDDYDEKF